MHLINTGAQRGQKSAADPLEMELEMVVSHLMWFLGLKPGSSAKKKYIFLIYEPFLQSLKFIKKNPNSRQNLTM